MAACASKRPARTTHRREWVHRVTRDNTDTRLATSLGLFLVVCGFEFNARKERSLMLRTSKWRDLQPALISLCTGIEFLLLGLFLQKKMRKLSILSKAYDKQIFSNLFSCIVSFEIKNMANWQKKIRNLQKI